MQPRLPRHGCSALGCWVTQGQEPIVWPGVTRRSQNGSRHDHVGDAETSLQQSCSCASAVDISTGLVRYVLSILVVPMLLHCCLHGSHALAAVFAILAWVTWRNAAKLHCRILALLIGLQGFYKAVCLGRPCTCYRTGVDRHNSLSG